MAQNAEPVPLATAVSSALDTVNPTKLSIIANNPKDDWLFLKLVWDWQTGRYQQLEDVFPVYTGMNLIALAVLYGDAAVIDELRTQARMRLARTPRQLTP